MLLIYPRQRVPNSEDLFCMDGDVASLTRCTAGWFYRVVQENEVLEAFEHARCIITVEFGRTCR